MHAHVCVNVCVRAFAGVNVCVEKERKFTKAYNCFFVCLFLVKSISWPDVSGQTPKFEAVDSFDLLYLLNKNLLFGNLTYQCNAKLSPLADGHRDCLGPGGLGAYGMH